MGNPDDIELAEACIRGDAAAWDALVERYSRLVYSVPRRYGFSDVECADVFQTVFLSLLEHLPDLRDRSRLGAWLWMTTRRACWRLAARSRRNRSPLGEKEFEELPDPDESPEDLAVRYSEYQAVRQTVEGMGGPCRQLLWYLYFDSVTPAYSDIALMLGVPVGSIGPTRARCLQKVRDLLQES